MLTFDRQRLAGEMRSIPGPSRVLFALLAATRLFSALRSVSPNAERTIQIEALHDKLWDDLASAPLSPAELLAAEAASLALLAPEDSDELLADDAAAALAYAFRSRSSDDPMNAVWAAERAYNYVDASLHSSSGDSRYAEPEHPRLQAELQRQATDLLTVRGRLAADVATSLTELRALATVAGASL